MARRTGPQNTLKDMAGQTFGRLTAIECVGRRGRKALWRCHCSCGAIVDVVGYSLRLGDSKSCGCLKKELTGNRARTHGMHKTTEWRVWVAMKDRCTNPKTPAWKDYGGRGITVCQEWLDSFAAFYRDMGPRPPNRTLDRLNNDKGYNPSNCAWRTQKEQHNNRRSNRHLTLNGRTMTMSQWAEEIGIEVRTLHARLKIGWSVEKALTQPLRPY